MTTRITASRLNSHLTCPHRVAMDATADAADRDVVSPLVQVLWERGVAHEHRAMAVAGVPALDLSALQGDAREAATRDAIAQREPLIYCARLTVHELFGEPDLLRWENGGYAAIAIRSGTAAEDSDEKADAKLRNTHGVQLALYTDILRRMRLSAGNYGYIRDVHAVETRYDLDAQLGSRASCLWEVYLRTRAAMLATLASPADSRPALGSCCKHCVWRGACLRTLRKTGDLTLLPELGRSARDALSTEFLR